MKIVNKTWILSNLKSSLQTSSSVSSTVKSIIEDIKKNGDKAVLKYVKKFENSKATIQNIKLSKQDLKRAYNSISNQDKEALKLAYKRIHYEDRIFGHQPHQSHQPYLREYIDGAEVKKSDGECCKQSERNRPEQNDERVTKAIELNREDKEYQHCGNAENASHGAALAPQFARLAEIVKYVAIGQRPLSDGFDKAQSLIFGRTG